MSDNANCPLPNQRTPWNKGKLIGARPPLRPKHVWSIRTRLLLEGRIRDLALFNLAIDSKLRGCDVVAVRVENVPKRLHDGTRDGSAEEDRAARQVRTDGSNSSSHRRLLEGCGQEAERISIRGSARLRPLHHHSAIRAATVGMDRQNRARSKALWHAFAAANNDNVDLSPNRKSTSRAALARAHQNRKHCQISRH
jgi:hypothetical protein